MSGRPLGNGFGERGKGIAGGNCTGGAPGSGRGAGLRGVGRSRRDGFGGFFVRRAGRVRRFGCGRVRGPELAHVDAGSNGPEIVICPGTDTGVSGRGTSGIVSGTRGVGTRSPGGSGVGFSSGRGGGNGFGGRRGSFGRGVIHGSRMNGRPKSGIDHRRLRMLAM